MLVHRPRLKTQGAAVTTVAMLALGACDDPSARTDLRPEGPPDVLAVMVLNDALDGLVEAATYCKPGDEKRPGLVGLPDFTTQQICPEAIGDEVGPVVNAAPELWYVRIMFDELLDPEIEELIPELDDNNQETGIYTGTLRNTQPVTLKCQDVNGNLVDVDYDGYYSPSGNNVTWPLGPSLVIKPNDPTIIPVESECEVRLLDNIRDKSGTPVPDEGNQRGPFKFRIAPVEVIAITPAPKEKINPEVGRVDLTFNVEIDAASIPLSAYVFDPPLARPAVKQYSESGVYVFGEMLDSTKYSFSFAPDTQVKDKCGKASTLRGDNLKTNFETAALSLVNIIPFQGPNAVPSRKIRINFNQIMDLTTLTEGVDYEWVDGVKPDYPATPTQIPAFSYDSADPSIIIVDGVYNLNTNYKFRLKAGAKITDCPGRNLQYPTAERVCSASTRELTIAADQLIDITTATSIASIATSIAAGTLNATNAPAVRSASVTTISGTGGQTVHKSNEGERVFVRLGWNQDMEGSTLASSEFTLTKADGTPVTVPTTPGFGTAATTTLDLGVLPAGSYKFTLKQGATINDRRITTPNTYMQAADRVFTFNVEVDEESPTFKCLGAP